MIDFHSHMLPDVDDGAGYITESLEMARLMVRRRWVHLIGSDAHSVYQRPPGLRRALEIIKSISGEEEARRIGSVFPCQILRGRGVNTDNSLSPPTRQI
ncbi:MAG: CpsB/CapC family capsule biosynthesis tyrosine phosphatase [Bacillota bacterium]